MTPDDPTTLSPSGTQKTFRCRRCGECCRWSGHVLLTTKDIARIALAIAIDESEFIET